jgi:hypothetical protein
MPVRQLVVETWEYGFADLWPELVALLEQRGEDGVRLEFLMGADGTRLIDGEKYLELAAEATVQLVPREAAAAGGA